MKIGIVTYEIAYSSETNKVCISTTDTQPAGLHWYTRDQIVELIALNGTHRELYESALRYFPAAHAASQS